MYFFPQLSKMRFPLCFLTSIVNPAKYFVVSTDKEHVSDVRNLEKRMMKEMEFDGPSEFNFSLQMCVAVMDSKGKFRRGVIEEKLAEDLYLVVLIDYGQIVQVSKSNMKVITNKQFMSVEPLAFIVVLHGLIPVKYVSFGANTKPRALKEWPPESLTFVQNLFKYNDKVVVQSIFIQDRIVYGELFVRPNPDMKFVPLRAVLCKNEFCVYSESFFLKHSGFDPVCGSKSVEFETKMEFVRRWQKECLPYQNTNHFMLPVPVSLLENKSTDKMTQNISTPRSISKSSKPKDQEVDDNKQVSEVSPPMTQNQGMGRGKLKLLLAEMRKMKEAAVVGNSECPPQRDSFNRTEAKISRGRGLLLQKYLELKKAAAKPDQEKSTITSPSAKSNLEGGSWGSSSEHEKSAEAASQCEINVTRSVSKLGRAVIRSGEFSEFSDSNELTELSLSTEDGPPPLVGNLMMVQKKESSVSNKDDNCCQTELNISQASIKSAGSLKFVSESCNSQKTELCPSESNATLRSAKSVGTWCFEQNIQGWSSNRKTSSNSWSPYVLFDDTFVEPVNTFAELPVQRSIIKNLEKGGSFSNLSQIQRWAIPAIRKQLNAVLIGSPKTGKTLSYVVPIMDYVQDKTYFEELPQGNGPSVVIVASSSRVCESVYYMCRTLVGNSTFRRNSSFLPGQKKDGDLSSVRIVMAHGGGCEKEVWVSLTNGCDILISTPLCLVRLLEMPIITNFERLTCLVLDEIDIISQNPFRKSLQILLQKAQFSTKDRHYQKILCGEKLTSGVDAIVKSHLKSYALVIGSHSEAVIYEGPNPSLFLVDQSLKAETLANKLKELKDKIKKSKILVVCELTPTAVALKDFLSGLGIPALLAHENNLAEELKDTRRVWKASTSGVMVVTDGVLNELNIKDVQILVHYDLPNKSKTNFYLRYSTLENFLQDKQTFVKARDRIRSSKVQDIIFIDDENHYQLPQITDFVMRLGGKVPPNVLQKCEEIRRQMEVNKRDVPICSSLLSFGRCGKPKTCPLRHAFIKALDSCEGLPTSGWVNFVVLRSHDASRFSARLTEHVTAGGETSKLEDRYLEIPLKLSEFYKNEDNLRIVGSPKLGDMCAVQTTIEEQEVFYRAKVVEYLKVDKHQKPVEVGVKLLDQGDVWRRKTVELYELPGELSKWPPTAVDVVVVGLQPLDFDASWSEVANNFSAGLLTQKLEEKQYWSGRVVLALKDTLFLNPIRRKQFLPELNVHVLDSFVERELINNQIASVNHEHLPRLQKLCGEAGIEVPKNRVHRTKDSAVVQPQWAFFDSDLVQVKFLAAENTSMIFLQLTKFEKSLQELEEDCQKEGERTAIEMRNRKKRKGSGSAQDMSFGMFCLALFEDGKWNRGRIESENEKEFYVFFVDHGDFLFVAKKDVVPISENLLLRLPCQAIECNLVGIKEEDECPLEVLKEIYSFSEDGREDLYAHVVSRDLKPIITKGRKYRLNLVDIRGTSLNKMLVDRELVSAVESEREHLQNVDMGAEDLHVEEEEKTSSEVKVSLDDNTFEGYFSNLGDDVFEDEEGQTFLAEFASRIFGPSAPPKENAKAEGQECVSSNSLKEAKKATPTPASPVQPAQQNRKRVNQKEKLQLKSREDVLTPQVLWCQNQSEVQLKILLGGVEDYSVECTVSNVSFRCFVGEKFYAMDLRLYGAINPSMTRVTVKAFHVCLVLTKLAFPLWPRLQADEGKVRWINLDVERLAETDGVFADNIATAKLEIESGAVKKGTTDDDVLPCSDTEDSDKPDLDSSSEEEA